MSAEKTENAVLKNINRQSMRGLQKLSDEETRAAADDVGKAKRHMEDLTPNELYVVIKSLPLRKKGMEEEMRFGVDYLHMLLDREGVGHVASFTRDIQRITDKEEGVYEYDFDDKSREALTAARKRHFIREFGITMGTGWVVAGLGTTAVAGAKTVADGIDLYLGEKPPELANPKGDGKDEPQTGIRGVRRTARKIYQVVEPPLGGPVELVIGGLLTAEGVHKWKETNDEQIDEISDAVSELAKRFPTLKEPPPAEKAGKPLTRSRAR